MIKKTGVLQMFWNQERFLFDQKFEASPLSISSVRCYFSWTLF